MKKALLITMVAVWAVIAIGAIIFLAVYLNGGSFGMTNISFGASMGSKMLKQEEISSDNVRTFELDTSFYNIEVLTTAASDFKVTQYGREDLLEEGFFKVERNGDRVTVSTKHYTDIRIGIFFSFYGEEKLVLEVPDSWMGTVDLEASSGSISLTEQMSFENLDASTSSGSIKLLRPVTAGNISLKSSSGSIKVEDSATVNGNFTSYSTSGSQRVEGRLEAGNDITMESSSGSIKLKNSVNCGGKIRLKATSGSINMEADVGTVSLEVGSSSGSIRLGRISLSDSYDISCTSGSIKVEGISGGGRIKSSSGSVTAELFSPLKDTSVSSSSGSITLTIPRDLSFEFEADTSSGSIRTDFEILYRSDRKNSAVATIGGSPDMRLRAEASSGSVKVYYK